MLDRILVPLDDSSLSHRILTVVRRLLRTSPRAQVRTMRVLTPAEADDSDATDPAELARGHLDHVVEVLNRQGFFASSSLYVGDPASAILEVADELEPSLIVMASHGRSGIPRWFRGSVAERVLEGARHPVLMANPLGLPEEPWWESETFSPTLARETEFRQILVPLDGSDASASILPVVAELARAHNSTVTLFHAGKPGSLDLAPFASRLEGIATRTLVQEGDPASLIVETAGEQSFDLVALTTHGRTTISRWAFGSVAEHVVRHCPAPILVKRTAGFPAASWDRPRPHAVTLPTE